MVPPPDILTLCYVWTSKNDPNVFKQEPLMPGQGGCWRQESTHSPYGTDLSKRSDTEPEQRKNGPGVTSDL